jgi:hypothetical protein
MLVNTALVSLVKAAAADGARLNPFPTSVIASLQAAVDEFQLAPDDHIDVGRLPTSVVSLTTLFAYLRSIQSKLSARDPKVKTEDWDVAKSGELRLYKLYVCAIHALHSYLSDSPDHTVNCSRFVEAVQTHARINPPKALSKNGSTLWAKTFDGTSPRTLSVITSLIYFCSRASGRGRNPPPPPSPPSESGSSRSDSQEESDENSEHDTEKDIPALEEQTVFQDTLDEGYEKQGDEYDNDNQIVSGEESGKRSTVVPV